MTTQTNNNNLDYLIDPTKNGNDDPTVDSFDEYYIPLVEMKDFNALIDIKQFLTTQ